MRSKHVYASVDLFKAYLVGDGFDADWTEDIPVLRKLLESASVTIENHMGGRSFGPFTATREYDLTKGMLRSRSELPTDLNIVRSEFAFIAVLGIIPLRDWLSAVPETVTAYDGSERLNNTVLTEGLANDYILEPYEQAPYHTLKLTENTSERLTGGQKTLTILADWGWQADTELTDNAVDDVSNIDDSQITITYDGTGDLSAGEILLLESEQVYVRTLTSTVLTVDRGVNGTTAATHDNDKTFSRYQHPSDVVEAALSIARDRYTSRESGATASIGAGGITINRPGSEQRAILKSLDYYRQVRELSGVYF